MKNVCFVICGLDSHLERIKSCIFTIRHIYNNAVFIGIATFGNTTVGPSKLLKKYSKQHNYYFYDAPRQDFIRLDREWHSCEILGMFSISKYFYNLGFDEVYLLHNDMFIIRDFLPYYRKQMIKSWSFICPFIYINKSKLSYKKVLLYNNFDIYHKKLPVRLTQSLIIFNKKFVLDIYNKYNNEKQMWDKCFINVCMYGDIGLFSIAKEFLGYKANPLYMKYTIDGNCWNKLTIVNEMINNKNICFVHGPKKFEFLNDKIKNILNEVK